ncbi:pyridoxamine kinase [Ruminococcus sp.]|uniref:pyridoxamine kinase n=1 Tax=Ruminococcus sp. TaxID=41978 RepID=UPI00386E0044
MTKKAVLINDLSGLGKCSLTAAIPVLSVMGIQACPMPTAVLTSQTGFKSFYCNDCTDKLDYYTSEWKNLGFQPDGIYTGFLSSEKQVDKILDFINSFETKDTLVLVDPVMGDGGRTYSLFTEALASKMKKLVAVADVITPNLTECCILNDVNYSEFIKNVEKPDFMDKVAELGKALMKRYGVKIVIVTGIEHKNTDGTLQIQNLITSADEVFSVSCEKIGGSYSGTGDLFASVMFSGLLRGDSLRDTVNLAVKFIETSLHDTVKLNIDRNEGIEFEKHLNILL